MIPLKNLNPRRAFPVMTLFLIAANVAVFIHQITLPPKAFDAFINTYGVIPSHIQMALAGRRYTLMDALYPLFTCMFVHGGFLHIIGNMWFLWIFGDNVEDEFGAVPYLFFYLFCGIVSGITQVAFSWGSHIPSVGASGAISGVLAAYVILFPRAKVLTLVPLLFFWFTARISAWVFIGIWFLLQFLSGLGSLGAINTGGVAWWAHVGGFAMGALITLGVKVSRGSPSRSFA